MKKLNEQLNRTKELMGILNEQEDSVYRWFATEEQYKDHEGSNKEQSVVLNMDLIKGDSMTDSKKVERLSWEGTEGTRLVGVRELEGKAEQINRKYNIDIKIPKVYRIWMLGEKKGGGKDLPQRVDELDNDIFNGDDAGDGQYRSDRDRHRRNPYSAKARFRAGLGKSL